MEANVQETSRRQELSDYTETGRLRDAVAAELSEDATDLLVDIVRRYCAPRRRDSAKAQERRSRPVLGPKKLRDPEMTPWRAAR
jgi:predicted AAA+ superfamily ATPase